MRKILVFSEIKFVALQTELEHWTFKFQPCLQVWLSDNTMSNNVSFNTVSVLFNRSERNDVLKQTFKKLHSTMVNNVNPASVINFLFQEDVFGADDMRALLKFSDDPQRQCSELLALVHTSGNRQAFVHLHQAIKKESHLKWLVTDIDKFTDQSLQQRYSEPTGMPEHVFHYCNENMQWE